MPESVLMPADTRPARRRRPPRQPRRSARWRSASASARPPRRRSSSARRAPHPRCLPSLQCLSLGRARPPARKPRRTPGAARAATARGRPRRQKRHGGRPLLGICARNPALPFGCSLGRCARHAHTHPPARRRKSGCWCSSTARRARPRLPRRAPPSRLQRCVLRARAGERTSLPIGARRRCCRRDARICAACLLAARRAPLHVHALRRFA